MRNPKAIYTIRVVAGLYLIYLAYDLIRSLVNDSGQPWYFWVLAVLFGACGLFFAVTSAISYKKMGDEERAQAEAEAEQEEAQSETEEQEDTADQPVQEEKKPMSLSERARLASSNIDTSDILEEIDQDEEEHEQ